MRLRVVVLGQHSTQAATILDPRGARAMLWAVGSRRDAVHVRMEDCSHEEQKVYKIATVVVPKPPVPVNVRCRSSVWVGRKSDIQK